MPLGPQPEQVHVPGGRPALDQEWLSYLQRQGTATGKRLQLWPPPGLHQAVDYFNSRRFFDSHESWEALWLATEYPIRLFYLAMAKLTAGFEQAHRGKGASARRLAIDSLLYLDSFRPAFMGLDTERLCQDVIRWLSRPATAAVPKRLRITPASGAKARP